MAEMSKQILEDLELLHREVEHLARPRHFPRQEIHLQIILVKLENLIRASATKQRPNPSEHLGNCKRLHEIVVGAAVESAHAIIDRVLRREDEDRRLQPALAQRREDCESISLGKHEIEHDAIERFVVHEKEALLARCGDADVVMLCLEPVTEGLRDLLFILHHEDPHRSRHYIGSLGPSHLTQMSGSLQWSVHVTAMIIDTSRASRDLTRRGRSMKQVLAIAVIVLTLLTIGSLDGFSQSGAGEGRETLTRALRGVSLPLERGLAASASQGTPLSAKYEIDDGAFQLSVYTWTVDAYSADSFAEVIVDHNTGSVAKVEAITDGGDLAAAQSQKAAMARSKRSLAEATAEAVHSNAGYRAVSAMPSIDGGRPVAEVTLVRGDEWKVVTERLD